MSKEGIKNIAASNRSKLLNLSRNTGQSFQEVVQYFAMSRFLYRLSVSDALDKFILKGAMLLHSLKITDARSTLDIDLLGQTHNSTESIRQSITSIIQQEVPDDGLKFILDSIEIADITEQADYVGKRVKFTGKLDTIRIPMQIDIGFGDRVVPSAQWIQTPSIIGYPTGKIKGYQAETAIAEKLQIMFQREILNSRMKDFYDIWLMINKTKIDFDKLAMAITNTFECRKTLFMGDSMIFTKDFLLDENKQKQWSAFCRKRGIENAPKQFNTVAHEVFDYIRPIIEKSPY